jgi:Leucine-rich repeat (LRR) protein
LAPEQIACNFLSLPSLADCRATASIVGRSSINGTTIPSELGLLTQLTHLSLFSKGLTGTIPQSLALLTQLSFLSFYNNALTGTIPSSFSSLTQLTGLGFDMNQMIGSIPSSFSSLTQLQDLAVFGNRFTGSIPTSLCAQMTRLRVDCGEITCDLSCPCASSTDSACSSVLTPEQIACNFLNLTSLEECRAAPGGGESVNGPTIPSELGLLTHLEYLALFSKGLTGTIPQSLALLTKLTFLSFYKNALTGTIPSSFSNLTLLTGMGFDMNQMIGSIPSSFSSLTQLQDLAVFGNQFTGSIPTSLCAQMTRLRIDCGEITCDASCPCASSTDTACP